MGIYYRQYKVKKGHTMSYAKPLVHIKAQKNLNKYFFWVKVTKKLQKLGLFRLSKITASFIK